MMREQIYTFENRVTMWAARYVNESDEYPTDGEMRRAFAGCVRPLRPQFYPEVRAEILNLQEERKAKLTLHPDDFKAERAKSEGNLE